MAPTIEAPSVVVEQVERLATSAITVGGWVGGAVAVGAYPNRCDIG